MTSSALAMLGERPGAAGAKNAVPHVVAWNLTRRCNLECAHCYIAAGPQQPASDELTTAECHRIIDEIVAVNPAPLFIFSGGEPLLRADLSDLARYATARGATVVVGTNGTLLTDTKIEELRRAGVTGVAVSMESLDPTYHDRFRRGHGSLEATLAAVDRCVAHRLDFVVQTTLTRANCGELETLARWAADRGAVSFNAYFLVATGRGTGMHQLSAEEHETLLARLVDLHVRYLGQMMVRAKCAPHFMRLVHQRASGSPILNYETRCPCGVQYCRITPDGRLTACPYLPLPAGDLRAQPFGEIWRDAELFQALRSNGLGGKCGSCEYRRLCGGCRARAYASAGDPLGADPSCAYDPDPDRSVIEPAPSVTYGTAALKTLPWTEAAEARIRRVPSFVRGVVIDRVEQYARARGHGEITAALLGEVRRSMPVDFSKRLPFFLADDG